MQFLAKKNLQVQAKVPANEFNTVLKLTQPSPAICREVSRHSVGENSWDCHVLLPVYNVDELLLSFFYMRRSPSKVSRLPRSSTPHQNMILLKYRM